MKNSNSSVNIQRDSMYLSPQLVFLFKNNEARTGKSKERMQGWGGGEDEWRVTANGDRVSFWGDGDILESGDGLHNTVNV